jgi:hypothetical protein
VKANGRFETSKQADGQEWYRILDLRYDSTIEKANGITKALLISENIVAVRPYHSVLEETSWRECALRRWLNDEYFDSLPESFRERIIETSNYLCGIPTEDTEDLEFMARDKVFILSADEAGFYFKDNEDRRAHSAKSWWLREQGIGSIFAQWVNMTGAVVVDGSWVEVEKPTWWRKLLRQYKHSFREEGLRSAFWLKLQEHQSPEPQASANREAAIFEIPELESKIRDCNITRNILTKLLAEFTDDYRNRGTSVEHSLRQMIEQNDKFDVECRHQALLVDPNWKGV